MIRNYIYSITNRYMELLVMEYKPFSELYFFKST